MPASETVHSKKGELKIFESYDDILTVEEACEALKVGYNAVHGYYIQISRGQSHLAPIHYVRRQTLKNAERYIIPELKEYEDKVLTSKGKALALEKQLYDELFDILMPHLADLQMSAAALAELDVLVNLAERAETLNYTCPTFTDKPGIRITEGRHPVVEQVLNEPFIANPLNLSPQRRMLIITGPNMGGKSTYMRQTALIALLAYIGSYVPAQKVEIGPVDRIFTRVGAADDLASGRSTFMVEMTEAADILNNLSERSLVLFDELGRGTSTYDGISIAWAIVEHIHEHPKARAKTLFATHYHELNEMERTYKRIVNYNVSVKEVDNKVIFLRKLVRGGSEHSFGIHVAKLAGMPQSIVKRANQILKQLESENRQNGIAKPTAEIASSRGGMQLSFFQLDDPVLSQVRDEILQVDINNLTPVEALNKLNEIRKIITGK